MMNRPLAKIIFFRPILWGFPLMMVPVVLAALSGCDRLKKPEVSVEKTPTLIRTLQISDAAVEESRAFPIFAKEAQTAKLSFRVPGQLLEFDPILGKTVKADEVVARLDPRDYRLAVERLETGILEAESMLTAMKIGARAEDVAALEAQIAGAETAVANAAKQLARMENLRTDGTASEVQYDLAKTASDTAVAHRDTLKTQLIKAKKGARIEEIQAMEAKIAGLKVDLTLAKNKLADTELKAPFGGVIAQKFFDNHETVAPGIPVLEIVDSEGIEATLNVPEDIIHRQGDIQSIICRFSGLSTENAFPAAIKEIGQTVQQGNLAYPLTVRLESVHDQAGNKILPGMTGTATLVLKSANRSTVIPTAALIPAAGPEPEKSAVWVFEAATGTIRRQPVQIAEFTPDGAVIASGLSGGETIVSAGARFLADGQSVRAE